MTRCLRRCVHFYLRVAPSIDTTCVSRNCDNSFIECEDALNVGSFDPQNMSECATDLVEPAKGKRELLPGIEPGIFSLQVRCFTAEP